MSFKKTNAARFLDTLKITYELTSYDVDEEDLSATHAAAMLGVTADIVFKTLVARDERNVPLVACIPANKEIDLKALARLANVKRCELVAVKELLALTGYMRGGCSPLGMKKKYSTFIDISAQNYPLIYVSAGLRGMQLHLNPQDLLSASHGVLGVLIKH